MYVVTRADLPAGHQATQAAHALAAFCVEHPDLASHWKNHSSYLVLLATDDEDSLMAIYDRTRGLPRSIYREPDFDNAATSVAIGPERIGDVLSDDAARRLLANLPLTLREPAMT